MCIRDRSCPKASFAIAYKRPRPRGDNADGDPQQGGPPYSYPRSCSPLAQLSTCGTLRGPHLRRLSSICHGVLHLRLSDWGGEAQRQGRSNSRGGRHRSRSRCHNSSFLTGVWGVANSRLTLGKFPRYSPDHETLSRVATNSTFRWVFPL